MKRRHFFTCAVGSMLVSGVVSITSAEGHAGSWVINAGVGGNNSADLLARVDKDCLAHKPDLTVLMVGTNDMNSKKYIPLDDFVRNFKTLIDKIKASGSTLLVMNLLPVYEPYLFTRHDPKFYEPEGHQERLLQMNKSIWEMAHSAGVQFIDLYSLFDKAGDVGLDQESLIKNDANSGTTDGLHPTPQGYRFLALAICDFILYHNLPKKKIVCFGDSITFGDGSMDKFSYPAYLHKLLS